MKKMMAIAFAIVIGFSAAALAQVSDVDAGASDEQPAQVSDSGSASDEVSASDSGESTKDSKKGIREYLKCLKATGFDIIACSQDL